MVDVRREDGCPESAVDEPLDFGQRLGEAERVHPEVTETHARTAGRESPHSPSIVGVPDRVKWPSVAAIAILTPFAVGIDKVPGNTHEAGRVGRTDER